MSVAYRQCHLVQPRERAVLHYTTWLPESYAVLGEVVRLRQDDGIWGEGGRVDFVGPWALPEERMRKAERAHLKQRRASDIGRSEHREGLARGLFPGVVVNGGTSAFYSGSRP